MNKSFPNFSRLPRCPRRAGFAALPALLSVFSTGFTGFSGLKTAALLFILFILSSASFAANVHFRWVNPIGGAADTNAFRIQAISTNVLANGQPAATIGLPQRFTPNTNGDYTATNLLINWYQDIDHKYIFQVYDSSSTLYDVTNLLAPGFNTYIVRSYGTNPPPTYDQVTNALGTGYTNNLYTNLLVAVTNATTGSTNAAYAAMTNWVNVSTNNVFTNLTVRYIAADVANSNMNVALSNLWVLTNTANSVLFSQRVNTNDFALTNALLKAATLTASNAVIAAINATNTALLTTLTNALTGADTVVSNGLSARLLSTNTALLTTLAGVTNFSALTNTLKTGGVGTNIFTATAITQLAANGSAGAGGIATNGGSGTGNTFSNVTIASLGNSLNANQKALTNLATGYIGGLGSGLEIGFQDFTTSKGSYPTSGWGHLWNGYTNYMGEWWFSAFNTAFLEDNGAIGFVNGFSGKAFVFHPAGNFQAPAFTLGTSSSQRSVTNWQDVTNYFTFPAVASQTNGFTTIVYSNPAVFVGTNLFTQTNAATALLFSQKAGTNDAPATNTIIQAQLALKQTGSVNLTNYSGIPTNNFTSTNTFALTNAANALLFSQKGSTNAAVATTTAGGLSFTTNGSLVTATIAAATTNSFAAKTNATLYGSATITGGDLTVGGNITADGLAVNGAGINGGGVLFGAGIEATYAAFGSSAQSQISANGNLIAPSVAINSSLVLSNSPSVIGVTAGTAAANGTFTRVSSTLYTNTWTASYITNNTGTTWTLYNSAVSALYQSTTGIINASWNLIAGATSCTSVYGADNYLAGQRFLGAFTSTNLAARFALALTNTQTNVTINGNPPPLSNLASGSNSWTEGYGTTASGVNSHAEGQSTTASGNNSHAQGLSGEASGILSAVFGSSGYATAQNSALFNQNNHLYRTNAIAQSFQVNATGGINLLDGVISGNGRDLTNVTARYATNLTGNALVQATNAAISVLGNLTQTNLFTLKTNGYVTNLTAASITSVSGDTQPIAADDTYYAQGVTLYPNGAGAYTNYGALYANMMLQTNTGYGDLSSDSGDEYTNATGGLGLSGLFHAYNNSGYITIYHGTKSVAAKFEAVDGSNFTNSLTPLGLRFNSFGNQWNVFNNGSYWITNVSGDNGYWIMDTDGSTHFSAQLNVENGGGIEGSGGGIHGFVLDATALNGAIPDAVIVASGILTNNSSGTNIASGTIPASALNFTVISNTQANVTLGLGTNTAAFNLVSGQTNVALATNWTNKYSGRIILTVDGTLNMAVAGSTIVTLTNLTTTESHVIAGSTVSISGTTYFSYPYRMSTNEVVQVIAANTGTATTTLTKTTVKRE